MGKGTKQGREYPGRLQWVQMPTGEHRWTGGPIICRQRRVGWIVELSKDGGWGRLSVPLAGSFESLDEAKEAAADLLLQARTRRMLRVSAATPVAA